MAPAVSQLAAFKMPTRGSNSYLKLIIAVKLLKSDPPQKILLTLIISNFKKKDAINHVLCSIHNT